MQRRSTRPWTRTFSMVAIGATVAALALTAPASAGATTTAAPSVLTKSVQDVTHPGANPAGHGDTLKWVLSYADNATADSAAATITDPISAAGTGQTYVPGSLQVPPGWTPSYSTDGTTFGGTDTGTSTVAVRATNPIAQQGGTSLANLLLAPVQPTATATNGDGYTPILYRTPSGDVQAWNMYHHTGAAAAKLYCSDLSTGAQCAGGPWPRPVNTTAGPLGTGNTGDIATTLTPQYVQDPNRPGVVYYAAVTAASVGVGCLNMATQVNCGYVPLEQVTNGTLSGFVQVGDDIYGVGVDGRVLCMAMSGQAPCANEPFAAIVPGNRIGANSTFEGSLTVADGDVFISSSPAGGPPVLGCFDPATDAACASWPAALPAGPAGSQAFDAYTAYDTAGNAAGACVTIITRPGGDTTCYALDGSPLTGPSVFDQLSSGQDVFDAETVRAPGGDLKSYFGVWGGSDPGGTVCYDWTTAAGCAGFPLPSNHPGANGGATRDYGYAYDQATQCLIGLGDAGILFSEDPTTGSSPCIHSGASVTVSPSTFYCDGSATHIQHYTNARLDGINLADVNLAASTTDVTDPDGTEIASPAFAPDGTIDLSGITVTAHPSINVSVHLVLNNSNDFTGGNQPHVIVSFVGDPPQVCFETTVASGCSATSVTNTANGTDDTGDFASNTVLVPVSPGAACQPDVTVDKEICAVSDATACGPGGAGPWVKQATAGVFGLLLAQPHWRITVTDNGPVGITGVRINDSVEPTCATATGPFSLAAGAGRQIYCSTTVLISLLPLTNTASATFLPANSPQGTPPTTTASSSAVACSLLCALRD